MKTTLHYSTFMTSIITTVRGNAYETYHNCITMEDARNWAEKALDYDLLEIPATMISKITFIDSNTGEVLMECERDEESTPREIDNPNYDTEWGYNKDCGFDPYEGCYTFDC